MTILIPTPTSESTIQPGNLETAVLRINPLQRHRIADEVLQSAVSNLQRLESQTPKLRQAAEDQLHELIGPISSDGQDQRRRDLIALRRDVHNDREPRIDCPKDADAVTRWAQHRQDRMRVRKLVNQLAQQQLDNERATMAQMLGDQNFLNGLALVSPEVHAAAHTYRRHQHEAALTSRDTKSERGLLQYLSRAMVRTSPLSRFTAVGLMSIGAGTTLADPGAYEASAFMSFDAVLLGQAVARSSALEPDPWVARALGTVVDPAGQSMQFNGIQQGRVRRMSVSITNHISIVLDLTQMGPRRLSEITSAAVAAGAPENIVRMLVGAGVLSVVPGPLDESDPRGMAASDEVRNLLAQADKAAHELAQANDTTRRSVLERINDLSTGLMQTTGCVGGFKVNEDYVLTPKPVAAGHLAPALGDLADAIEVLSVFDRSHEVRAMALAAFVEKFGHGARVPLVEASDPVVQTVYRREAVLSMTTSTDIGPRDGRLAGLLDVRNRILDHVVEACSAHDGSTVALDRDRLLHIAADLPEVFHQGPLSYATLVQVVGHDDLVLNDAYSGHGMLTARFLQADTELGGTARERLSEQLIQRYTPRGGRLLEDRGLHGLSVNGHVPVLPEAITPSGWYDLFLRHDTETDNLVVEDRGGAPVNVLALGAGLPEIFPFPLRLASWLINGGRLVKDLSAHVRAHGSSPAGQTCSVPRLRLGHVIISRQRWYPGEDWDAAANAPEESRMVALTSWRATHHVPGEVVLKTPLSKPMQTGDSNAVKEALAARRVTKPQYLDLESALMVRALPRMVRRREGTGEVVIEEALPGVGASAHAFEWLLDLFRPAGGRFQAPSFFPKETSA